MTAPTDNNPAYVFAKMAEQTGYAVNWEIIHQMAAYCDEPITEEEARLALSPSFTVRSVLGPPPT